MDSKPCVLSKIDGEFAAEETLALCQNCLDAKPEFGQNAEKISDDVQDVFNGIYCKLRELRNLLQNNFLANTNKTRSENAEINDAIKNRIIYLLQLKTDLEKIQIRFRHSLVNPSAEELADLISIRKQVETFIEENKKCTREFAKSRLLANENLNISISRADTVLLNSNCAIDPEQVYLHIQGSYVVFVKENLDVYVVSPETSSLLISNLRFKMVNLSTDVSENVRITTVYENAICFESSRLDAGQYVISCCLNGKPISCSPIKIDVSKSTSQNCCAETLAVPSETIAEKYFSPEITVRKKRLRRGTTNEFLSQKSNGFLFVPREASRIFYRSRYSNPSNKIRENLGERYTCVTPDGKILLVKKSVAQKMPYFCDIINPKNIESYLNGKGEIMLEDGLDLRYLQPIIASLEQNNVSLLLSMLPEKCDVYNLIEMCDYLEVPLDVTDDLFFVQKSLSRIAEIGKVVTEFCLSVMMGNFDEMPYCFWCKIYEIFLTIFQNKWRFLSDQMMFHLCCCAGECFEMFSRRQQKRLKWAMY